MDPLAFAELGAKFGGWAVAGLLLWLLLLERAERKATQDKLDALGERLPTVLVDLVTETRLTIQQFTTEAGAVVLALRGKL